MPMALPKYISHPILLATVVGLVASALWLHAAPADWPAGLWEITGFARGRLALQGTDVNLVLADKRFTEVPTQAQAALARFFIGKLVKIDVLPVNGKLELPVELYDPSCFKLPVDTSQCPIVLTP